jgi:hypothetical protein
VKSRHSTVPRYELPSMLSAYQLRFNQISRRISENWRMAPFHLPYRVIFPPVTFAT